MNISGPIQTIHTNGGFRDKTLVFLRVLCG